MNKYYIGIDVGGTTTSIGLINHKSEIIDKIQILTKNGENGHILVKSITEVIDALLDRNQKTIHDIIRIGTGFPGKISPKEGIVIKPNNLDISQLPFTDMLEKVYNIPATLCNDAVAAVCGEYLKDKNNHFAMITLGTGVGSGVVSNGKLFINKNGRSPELGHMVINAEGRLCRCGKRGCFESYASATAIINYAKVAIHQGMQTQILEKADGIIDSINAKMVFDAADNNDAVANKLVQDYIRNLAIGIMNVSDLYFPNKICLSGGIAKQGNALIKRLMPELQKKEIIGNRKVPKVYICESIDDVATIGAALIADMSV
ncbi:MAG: ROK family protein [Lachnospirales bacterium]